MTGRRISLSGLVFGHRQKADIEAGPTLAAPAASLASTTPVEASSVLQALNDINKRLERTLFDLRGQTSADNELRTIAGNLITTVERHRDIALGAVFLNQIAGTYAVRHCTEVAIVVALIGRAMNKSAPELVIIVAAALTMNVGMVRQTDIFQNKDSALSVEERALVRRHPTDSVELLRWAGITDQHWLDCVLLHHENDDGSGYPEGKLGSEITQNAKLIGLADRYCAFVSARNYRRSLLPPVALDKLRGSDELPADPAVLAHFAEQIGAYPPGTLVRLQNGEIGVVADASQVFVMRGADGAMLAQTALRDATAALYGIDAALHEDDARLRFTMRQVWGELAAL